MARPELNRFRVADLGWHRDLVWSWVSAVRWPIFTTGTGWLQDTDWSRALRDFLERWLDTTLTSACGTDEQSQRRYRHDLAAAGFEVSSSAVDYVASLDLNQIVGGVYSALPLARLPAPDQRPAFAEQVRMTLGPRDHFSERVHVAILAGRVK